MSPELMIVLFLVCLAGIVLIRLFLDDFKIDV